MFLINIHANELTCDFALIAQFVDVALVQAGVVHPQVLYEDGEVCILVLIWEGEHTSCELWIYFILSAVDDVRHTLVPTEGSDWLKQPGGVNAGWQDLIPDEAGAHRLVGSCGTTAQVSYRLPVHSSIRALCFSSLCDLSSTAESVCGLKETLFMYLKHLLDVLLLEDKVKKSSKPS